MGRGVARRAMSTRPGARLSRRGAGAAGPAAYNASAASCLCHADAVRDPIRAAILRRLAAPPLPRCAGAPRPLRRPRRSSGSRSPASAPRSCRWRWPTSATKTSAGVPLSAIVRADLRAQRPVPRRRRPAPLDESSQRRPGRLARPRRRRAGGRLGDAPGRRPLRRALQALGRGQGRGAAGPEQGRARRPTCAWPRTASPTRSTRSSPARAASSPPASPTSRKRGQPLHAARHRRRRRRRAGGAGQPRAHHLAGLVARRQAAGLRVLRDAEGGGLGAGRGHRRAPHGGQLPRLQQRAGLVARRPAAGA